MFTRLVIVGLLIFSFAAGYYLALPKDSEMAVLQSQLDQLRDDNASLVQRNTQLEGTLGLVKRQIQTDRIAYQSMQQAVEAADQQRESVLEKLNAQRELLDRLKKQISE